MSKDRELDKYLEGKAELSKLYAELPQVELPRHLDAVILAEAHRAVASRPGAKPKRHWTIPLGMVATLFVAVMIGLQLPYMLKDTDLPQPQTEQNVIVAASDKSTEERSSAAPVERKKTQETARFAAGAESDISRGTAAPMEAEVPAPATQNAPVLALPPAAVAAKRMEMSARADVDSARTLSKEKKAVGYAEGKLSDSIKQSAPFAATKPAPAPMQLNRSLMQPLKEEAGNANLTPADWLARIKQLKQEGKPDEAKKELTAFKKRYPDYRVPRELEF